VRETFNVTAGDIGVTFTLSAGGYNMTGAVVTFIAAPVQPGATPLRLTPCVVQPGGLTAVYTSTGADFTVGGPWNGQLEVVVGGAKFTSPQDGFYVNPHL
jgi:hypothetical protein